MRHLVSTDKRPAVTWLDSRSQPQQPTGGTISLTSAAHNILDVRRCMEGWGHTQTHRGPLGSAGQEGSLSVEGRDSSVPKGNYYAQVEQYVHWRFRHWRDRCAPCSSR